MKTLVFTKFLSLLLFALITFLTSISQPVLAANCQFSLSTKTPLLSNNLVVTVTSTQKNHSYYVAIHNKQGIGDGSLTTSSQEAKSLNQTLTFNIKFSDASENFKEGAAELIVVDITDTKRCNDAQTGNDTAILDLRSTPTPPEKKLTISTDPPSPIKTKVKTLNKLVISNLEPSKTYKITLYGGWNGTSLGDHGNNNWPTGSRTTITATNICNNGNTNRDPNGSEPCRDDFTDNTYNLEVFDGGKSIGLLKFQVNTQGLSGGSGKNPCATPVPDPNDPTKTIMKPTDCPTAIGDIPTDIQGFAARILEIAIGLAGGLALILMVIGSVRVLTSSGDQQKLAAGRDMIVAAVAGLLFLIFSVLILRFIGIQILNL